MTTQVAMSQLLSSFAGSTSPAGPTAGQLWYDTGSSMLKVYDGSTWVAIGTGSGSGGSTTPGVRTNVFTGNAGNQWYDLSQHGPGTYLIEITSGFNNSHSYDTQIYFIANYDGSTAMGLVIGFNLGSPNIYFYSTPYGGTVPDKYALVIGTFTQSSYLSYTDWTGRYIGSSPYGASGSVRAINPATDTAYGSSNTHGEITNIWQIT